MGAQITTLDLVIFLVVLLGVMFVGVFASLKEDSSEDYFLAGKSIKWWGVAGSIFGSNVSANQLVGMLGIGYSIGFAQSHFELGAVAALMLLCYGFLPVYRKLKIFTLSDYLGQRYGDLSQMLYAVFLIILILIHMTAGFYIGSRSLKLLLAGSSYVPSYELGVILLAALTAAYTIFGGLKAVIFTDVIQSLLLLIAGVLVAVLTFIQPEVGGWTGMMARDVAQPLAAQKMHLYLPSNHPKLPWSGALTGLLVLHCFYWSTNQYIVQRALGAESDSEARKGIIFAGFGKLLIPFFAIAGGVAAAQLFQARLGGLNVAPDAAMPELIKMVVPVGYGLFGVIIAGLLGAILSSLDSMMNSAATLITFDIYKKWLSPKAKDKELIWVGRVTMAVVVSLAAYLAITTYSPDSKDNFFLKVSSLGGHFTPGLVVAFALGMFWTRGTAAGASAAIITGPIFSFNFQAYYNKAQGIWPELAALFGTTLNFMHRVMLTVIVCVLVHIIVSLLTERNKSKEQFTFFVLGGQNPEQVKGIIIALLGLTALYLYIAGMIQAKWISPTVAAFVVAIVTGLSFRPMLQKRQKSHPKGSPFIMWQDDLFWACILCSSTMFIMFYFF